jgi:hypothetical protein
LSSSVQEPAGGALLATFRRASHKAVLEGRTLPTPAPERRLCQAVGLGVVLARHMRNRKPQSPGEFAARPMKRVQTRASADVLSRHLPHNDLGIRKHMELWSFQSYCILQGFHQSGVFGDVIILMADPLSDSDGSALAPANDYPNTGGPGISQASAVHIGHKFPDHFSFR